MLEMSNKTNLLEQKQYKYSLQDVPNPNLYRDIYPYDDVPRVAFNHRRVPMGMPEDIWITDTSFRDGQQSVEPYTVEQIVALYKLMARLGGPYGVIRQTEFFVYSEKDRLYEEPIADLFGVTLEQIRQNGEGDGVRISCGGHAFLAKYSHIRTEEADFSLILTQEITEEENLRRIMKESEPAVSYIMIDNLEEMMQYDSELYRPAAAKIDAALRAWAESHNGILKEFERDKYLFLTDAKGMDSIVSSKFDILGERDQPAADAFRRRLRHVRNL